MADFPKISFGVIVLNGEPFTKYCLRQIYPFAHEIILVEGATSKARVLATENGHSTDGTLEALNEFKRNEDSENKLKIIMKEGFWPEKDEMSQAYAREVTGDYLWQIDIDEFYRAEDMRAIIEMLKEDSGITAVSFKTITFWGRPDYMVQNYKQRTREGDYHRLFKWGPGYKYVTHRPPTVVNAENRDLREIKHVKPRALASRGTYLYHYSMLFPKQVEEKCTYYEQMPWDFAQGLVQWAQESFHQLANPFRVSLVRNIPSWLCRYGGTHPEVIEQMSQDVLAGRCRIPFRKSEDVEELLRSRSYRTKRFFIRSSIAFVLWWLYGPYGRTGARKTLTKIIGRANVDKLLAVRRRLMESLRG